MESMSLIGKIVHVDAVYKLMLINNDCLPDDKQQLRIWRRYKSDGRPGLVVAVESLRDCQARMPMHRHSPQYTQYQHLKEVPCLSVMYWPTLPRVFVPPTHCRIAALNTFIYPDTPLPASENTRLRAEIAAWPRDENGDWLSAK